LRLTRPVTATARDPHSSQVMIEKWRCMLHLLRRNVHAHNIDQVQRQSMVKDVKLLGEEHGTVAPARSDQRPRRRL
jgi:hypothetical protein